MRRSRFSKRFKEGSRVLALVGLSLFFASVGRAAVDNLGADWSRLSRVQGDPNCSFMSDYRHTDAENFMADVLDRKTALSLGQRYQDLSRDYELKRQYGLVDAVREQQRGSEVQDFGRQIFGEVRRYQTSIEAKKLKGAADHNETLQAMEKPAAVVAAGAALYNGTPVKLNIDDDTRLNAFVNGRSQTGQFALTSAAGTTSVDLDMNKPDPNQPYSPNLSGQHETYRLSFSRGLPLWDLSSGLTYGGSTSSVGASLSKALAPNLTAVVDTVRPVQAGRYVSEESLKFFYGLSF